MIVELQARYKGTFAREDGLIAEREAARAVARSMTRARDELLQNCRAARAQESAHSEEIAGLRAELAETKAALLNARDGALAEANARAEATQITLTALLASISWCGLRRRKFRALIAEAARTIPDEGPAAVQHHILLSEVRKVLTLNE
ncbi:atp-dependent helicase [Methylobacterium sp. J-030]|uniref:atp-dependent helicase n=1 Tax=Methylobacterium sp. J-030 TaxID=2836627 RepID=UPI001FB9E86B|nr:atp-dependent helicase [Methylobacterium sp. J-030]MCJ2073110.1 atp-dependent helicase [Methylobacterium sp. J-030]